jgi:hypothetical protein
VRRQAVDAPGAVEEHRGLVAATLRRGEEGVAGSVAERQRVDVVALGRAHPAALRQHDGDRLGRQQSALVQGLGRGPLDNLGAAIVAVLLGVSRQLVAHQSLEAGLAAEDLLQRIAFLRQRVLLAADLHLLELGQVAQAQLEDRLGLRSESRSAASAPAWARPPRG